MLRHGSVYISLGWETRIPSLRKGRDIAYFTPNKLSAINREIQTSKIELPLSVDNNIECLNWYLFDHVRRTPGPLSSASSFNRVPLTTNQLLELAEFCTGSPARIRADIVYGGRAAGDGTPVFALEDEVQPLIRDLLQEVNSGEFQGSSFAYLVAMQSVFLMCHPFRDGNGRVARHLVRLCAARAGNAAQGAMISAATMIGRERFVGALMAGRSAGLTHVLGEIFGMCNEASPLLSAATEKLRLMEGIGLRFGSSKTERARILHLFHRSGIAPVRLDGLLGWSRRKEAGFMAELASELGLSCEAGVDTRGLRREIEDVFLSGSTRRGCEEFWPRGAKEQSK